MKIINGVMAYILITALFGLSLLRADATPVDYSPYSRLLENFVDSDNMVDYRSLKQEPADLNKFLQNLKNLPGSKYESLGHDQKIAFWINAYNACVLKVIIDNYPIQTSRSVIYPDNSIRQIPGVWNEITFDIMNEPHTLNKIQNQILRRSFYQPYIHMALVSAEKGCPPLRKEPYKGDELFFQFSDQISIFLSDSGKFKYKKGKNLILISPIFKWYGEDFESPQAEEAFPDYPPKDAGILYFLKQNLPQDHPFFEEKDIKYKIEFLDYDWSLNES